MSEPISVLVEGAAVPRRPDYRLIRPLGRGGFGEVWLAEHRETGEPRVFKFASGADRRSSLELEIELFEKLRQALGPRRDIASMLDWDFEEEPYFVASEYASGGDLQTWTESRGGPGALPLAERLELIAQAADALADAHSVGVLHKDVKPGNLLVHVGADGSPQIRLADFGIGRLVDPAMPLSPGSSASGVPAGSGSAGSSTVGAATRFYEAPELTEGRAPTVQADIYSLGVVLYQVILGQWGEPLASGWERDIEDEVLREILADACAGRPERRLAGAGELAERLRQGDAERRRRREAVRRAEEEARRQEELERSLRRRRWTTRVALLLLLWSGVMVGLGRRIDGEVERARREIETAGAVSDFLVGLFEGGDPRGPDGGLSVEALLDRGAERARRDLRDRPEVQGPLLQAIAGAYARLGLYARAKEQIQGALEAHGSSGGDSTVEAELLRELGNAQIILGNLREGHRLVEQSLEIYRSQGGPPTAGEASCLTKLAAIALRENRLEVAETFYRRAVDILEGLPEERSALAIALADRSQVYELQGRDDEALASLRRARLLQESLPPDYSALGRLYATLGDTYAGLERWDEAEPVLALAREILEPRLGPDHPYLAAVLSVLGRVYRERGESAAAEEVLRRSIEIVDRTLGPRSPFLGSPLRNLAEILRERGDHPGAVAVYDRMIAVYEGYMAADDPRLVRLREEREAALAAGDRAP